MANRRAEARNRIRGPQSALTDFLASHNISAQQITEDYQRRLREAEQGNASEANDDDNEENGSDDGEEDAAERKKRKRKEEKMLMKVKQSKEFKKRKYENKKRYGSDNEEDDDDLAKSMLAKNKFVPGQLENCELCEKRFTVTPYSKTGPDGGLLCAKCSKELKDEVKKTQNAAKKKAAPRARKRQTESDRMMGDVQPGAKSLVDQCVRKVADVVNDIDDFGDMPQTLLDRLSQILSRKRVLTPRTLTLFLRDDSDTIDVYDAGKLEVEDFHKIFAHMPHVKNVNLRFAGQLKDPALLYMAEKCNNLSRLQLGATNLVSDKSWISLFKQRGPQLESLKLSELNDSLHDSTILELAHHCTNLKCLKLRSCSHMSEASISTISKITTLQHLTLRIAPESSSSTLTELITSLGPNLHTLCLEAFPDLDDSVLAAIKSSCHQLRKLRLTGSSQCTDAAFASLFTDWPNTPLSHIDLSENRDIDSSTPDGPQDAPLGFGSEAFKAAMAHSRSALESLDLHSCRHISHASLTAVFDGTTQYPLLRDIDLSFVAMVDEEVMAGIFRCCPSLKKLAVFACFSARAASIPFGIAVIGLPNAQDNIVQGEAMDLS